MLEMPTHEEEWCEGVLFPKCDAKKEEVPFGWQHLDGNFVLEPCDQMGSRI